MLKPVVVGIVSLVWSASVGAETLTVCLDGSCDFSDIQSGIDFAQAGDVIEVGPGTYLPAFTLDTLGKSITIQGSRNASGVLETWVRGAGLRPMRCVRGEGAGTSIVDIGFEDGSDFFGGALYIHSSAPSLTRCEFVSNEAYSGGAIWIEDGSPVLIDCVFVGNGAFEDGGAVRSLNSDPTFRGCTFLDNYCLANADVISAGGAVRSTSGEVTFETCVFEDNSAYFGGALFLSDCRLLISGSVFDSNHADDQSGAIQCDYGRSGSAVTDTEFRRNTCDRVGGALVAVLGEIMLDGCRFSENTALYNAALGLQSVAAQVLRCDIRSNAAEEYSAVNVWDAFGSPSVTIGDSLICGNSPSQLGGVSWSDLGGNYIGDDCSVSCPEDIDSDGQVAGSDLSLLLSEWAVVDEGDLVSDLNGDGVVGGEDLSILLSGWGNCPGQA